MPVIEVMNENLASKIRAGEVIEKCMNVVKELVENSIDAKSDEIKINLLDGGLSEISVIDNGIGMEKEDAILSFSRHATSKIKNLEDLFYIESLGFRGEAIPSIAAVSKFTLQTCKNNKGTEIIVEGGKIKEVNPSSLRTGTKIIVKNLFYNTPVRLKYLSNNYVELANILDYLNKMALSFPNIRFILTNNDRVLLNTDGSGNLLKVISNIYGYDIAKKMINFSSENDDYKISGYISLPECAKTSKNNINLLVNNRYIKSIEVNKSIIEAYHTYIPDGKVPIVVLNIEADPILIDVNVHPTKMQVKFSKFNELKDLIIKTIRENLNNINLIPKIEEKIEEPIEEEISFDFRYDKAEKEIVKEEPSYDNISLDFDSYEVNEKEEKIEEQERIKKMYPVGLVHNTYIIAENEDGMFIIDQHAAHERVNYERYLDALSSPKRNSIEMLVPLKIEMNNRDYLIIKERMSILEDLGFEIEEFGTNTLLVRKHPTWLLNSSLEELVRVIINIVIETSNFDHEKFVHNVAASVACKASIKAGYYISLSDMEDLLEQLRKTKNPFTCPHGRPCIINFSKYELEKLFKRVMI